MYVAGGVLLSPQGLQELTGVYQGFLGKEAAQGLTDYTALVNDKKINVSQEALGSDVNTADYDVYRDMRAEP